MNFPLFSHFVHIKCTVNYIVLIFHRLTHFAFRISISLCVSDLNLYILSMYKFVDVVILYFRTNGVLLLYDENWEYHDVIMYF